MKHEEMLVFTYSLLHEEHRAGIIEFDGNYDKQIDWGEEQKPQERKKRVKQWLEESRVRPATIMTTIMADFLF